jgi:cytochrome P450
VRDMNVEMTNYMRRLTSAILFGLDYPTLSYRIGELTDRWVEMNHLTGLGAFVSDPGITDRYDELLQLASELESLVQELIELKRAAKEPGRDVLSILMQGHDEFGSISDAQMIGHIVLLFGAAHLTTAHTLVWTLFLLAQHPSVMSRLAEELAAAPLSNRVMDQRGSFAERVLRESMRILPASAYSQRVAAENVQVGPYRLNRGTTIIFSQFMTHHRPDLYPQPERFLPDRWLKLNPSAYEYLPFGAGPRMCLGASLAMRTLGSTLPPILTRFRLAMSPNAEVNCKVIGTMLGPTSSVPMEIHPADGQFEARPVTGSVFDLVELPEMPRSVPLRRAA